MSYAGLGALFSFVFYCTLSVLALLFVVKIFSRPRRKLLYSFLALLSIGLMLVSYRSKQRDMDEAAKPYIGAHKLKTFNGSTGCVLTYLPDHSYHVQCKGVKIEEGKWDYFDDGDIAFIEVFINGVGYEMGHEDMAPPEYDFENFIE